MNRLLILILPALLLAPGDHMLTYSGSGAAEIRYREAVLR